MIQQPEKFDDGGNEDTLIQGQVVDYMEGIGASDDHNDIRSAFMSLGLKSETVALIMAKIVGKAT